MLERVGPYMKEIENELAALKEMKDIPAGNIRITAGEHAVDYILWPVLQNFLSQWPDINVELTVDNALTDIVGEQFDAGIRLGEAVAKDMIAIPISPDLRMAVVGSAGYFTRYGIPKTPGDLQEHRCINMRSRTQGGMFMWDFSKKGKEIKIRVGGQLVLEPLRHRVEAARTGLGLAYVPEDVIASDINSGKLERVLVDWCEPFPGYYLYYPNRRQHTRAFSLFIEAIRQKSKTERDVIKKRP